MPTLRDRYRGCLLGLACGDAVGTAVEFKPRGSFAPLTDMVGGGLFRLAPGQWTDDTSMALCLAQSLLDCDGFDAADQMRRYVNWWRHGESSSTGRCFDIGMTVQEALQRFEATGEPFSGSADPDTAGNGSLMRLAPVVLFHHPDLALTLHFAAQSSRTTHAAPEAVECCCLFAHQLSHALAGEPKAAVLQAKPPGLVEPRVVALARGIYLHKSRDQIAGTGYCIASLEAALWCFEHTTGFEAAVLSAANLGDDADTTAALVGQLAGAFYGVGAIPKPWLAKLHDRATIQGLADALLAAALRRGQIDR